MLNEVVWFRVKSADGVGSFVKVPIPDPSRIFGTLFVACLAEGIKPTDYRMLGASEEVCVFTSNIGNLRA
ncbi:hypothetical protein C4544_07025 [candidate division WS5 bacterium]|uniref:Uncharacterized protein n=1 Tax=candidate division WS5 bacterium TaxID=2093353 RepID=A0A419DAF7_9BACT|nr:MAG: hypothetical protein C4544_07025 [candidate division WS5 bacterium]